MADPGRPRERDHAYALYPLPVMHPGQRDLSGRGAVCAADLVQGGTQAAPYLLADCVPSLVQESMIGRGVSHYNCPKLCHDGQQLPLDVAVGHRPPLL